MSVASRKRGTAAKEKDEFKVGKTELRSKVYESLESES